jgi:shikimate 5-dehydrogenase
VESWRSRGGSAADGLDLLLWQAADQIRIFTGSEPPLAQMRAALMAGDADMSLTRPG